MTLPVMFGGTGSLGRRAISSRVSVVVYLIVPEIVFGDPMVVWLIASRENVKPKYMFAPVAGL